MNLLSFYFFISLSNISASNSSLVFYEKDSRSLKETVKPKKEISKTVNIQGHEVTEVYRGLVIIIYSDGTTFRKIQ